MTPNPPEPTDVESVQTQDLALADAQTLLAIPLTAPETLFSADRRQAEREWQVLRSRWHPDRNSDPRASWVFTHLDALRQHAERRREGGVWDHCGVLDLQDCDGRRFRLRYLTRYPSPLGTMYLGTEVMAQVSAVSHRDLVRRGVEVAAGLPYADEDMRTEMSHCLPATIRYIQTRDHDIVVSRKGTSFAGLRQLRDHFGGAIDPVHVAWIVSALLNIGCYLESMGLAHQAIDIDNCLVSPKEHAVALVGGWEFCGFQGEPMSVLPEASVRLAPPDVLHRRVRDIRLDQYLVRASGLALLGNCVDQAPAPMRDFLLLPPTDAMLSDYEAWGQVLWESFGERRFVPLAVTAADLLGPAAPIAESTGD